MCGMSVVDGDWDTLKRYNLAELYPKPEKSSSTGGGEVGEAVTSTKGEATA